MTNIHKTPSTKNSLINNITNDLEKSLATKDDFSPLDTLFQQVKSLAHLHQQLIEEAAPKGLPFSNSYNKDYLSIALRAQNQFCRSLVILEHLENRALDRMNSSNELQETVLD